MNIERQDNNDERDTRVSEAYRDLARERTRPDMDDAVLHEAQQSARSPFLRSTYWFRPLAWAATVGLCLAIVLEVTQVGEQVDSEGDAALPSIDANREPAAGREEAGATATPEADAPTSGFSRETEAEAPPMRRNAAQSPDTASRPDARDDAPAAVGTESGELQDLRMLREAEERARVRAGNVAEPVRTPLAPAPAEAHDTEYHCDESRRQDPNEWLECIGELERDGLHDAAHAERQRLREVFPGAELIDPRPGE